MFIQNSIEKNFREITGKLALIIITDQPSTRRAVSYTHLTLPTTSRV